MLRKNHRAWQRMLSGRSLDLLHPSPIDKAVFRLLSINTQYVLLKKHPVPVLTLDKHNWF